VSGDGERPTWDEFLRTALVLRQTMTGGDDCEVFEAAWAFLSRAHERYHRYRYNLPVPLSWTHEPFIPPLLSLEEAACRIAGKPYKGKQLETVMDALKEFLSPELFEEARERGGLSAHFCDQVKENYRKWRLEEVREKQQQGGKEKIGNLKRGTKKPKQSA
jgi:hypothetical protein